MRTTVSLIVALVVCVPTALGQQVPSSLFAAINVAEYLGETYTEAPTERSRYVFFRTEPIALRVTIANPADQGERLTLDTVASGGKFEFVSERDGKPVFVEFEIERGLSMVGGQSTPLLSDEVIALSPSDRVDWLIRLRSTLQPGHYKVTVRALAADDQQRPLVWRGSYVEFEVRPQTSASRPEETYRKALRHLLWGGGQRLARARAEARALLAMHPGSFAAQTLFGKIAEAEGDSTSAERFFQRAVEIVEKDQDVLLRRFKTKDQIDELKKRSRRPQ